MAVVASKGQHGAGPVLLEVGIALAIFGVICLLGQLGRLRQSSASTQSAFMAVGVSATSVGVVLLIVGAVL